MFSLCSGVWNAYVDADGAVFCEPQWVVLPGETPPSKRIEEIGTAVAAGRVESTLVAPDTWVERVRGMPKEQRDSVDSSVPSGPLSWWK
jgi:hypothetical protein